jgi:hypothetical protein
MPVVEPLELSRPRALLLADPGEAEQALRRLSVVPSCVASVIARRLEPVRSEAMSYVVPGPKPRPGVVTAAAGLLFVSAGFHGLSIVVAIIELPYLQRAVQSMVQDQTAPRAASNLVQTTTQAGVVFGIVVAVLLGAALAVLGVFVGKGSQAARVTTWVIAGLMALSNGCGLGSTAFTALLAGRLPQPSTGGSTTLTASDIYPAWINAWTTANNVVNLVALVLVIVFLARPAASEYFRKPPALWVPAVGYYPPGPYQPYPPNAGYPAYQSHAVPGPPTDAPSTGAGRPPAPTDS